MRSVKLVLLGAAGVGKTTLSDRFCLGEPHDDVEAEVEAKGAEAEVEASSTDTASIEATEVNDTEATEVNDTEATEEITGTEANKTGAKYPFASEHSYRKLVSLPAGPVDVCIIDTASSRRLSTDKTVPAADAFMLVFRVTDAASFRALTPVYNVLRGRASRPHAPCILVGNGCEAAAEERQVSQMEGFELASMLRCPYVETSGTESRNVVEAFETVLALCVPAPPKPTRLSLCCTLL